jgi:hypothetical protein
MEPAIYQMLPAFADLGEKFSEQREQQGQRPSRESVWCIEGTAVRLVWLEQRKWEESE